MVVWINRLRKGVGGLRNGVRSLEHLPDVHGMEVGKVVRHPVGNLAQNRCHCGARRDCGTGADVRESAEVLFQARNGLTHEVEKNIAFQRITHHEKSR